MGVGYRLENNKRKYFDRDDFYDWGTDHDIMKASEWLGSEINLFTMMLRNKPRLEIEIDKELKSFIDDHIDTLNFNMEEKFLKMIYLNFYIVADECLGRIYKAICMYNRDVINRGKVKVEFDDVFNSEDKNDIMELFVDNILDQNLTGISSKLKEINKICKKYYEFEIDKTFIEEVNIFRIERNLLVHSNGLVNKKALKDLSKIYPNLKIGDKVEYTLDKIDKLLDLFGSNIWKLYEMVCDFYDPSKYYEEMLAELDNEKHEQY